MRNLLEEYVELCRLRLIELRVVRRMLGVVRIELRAVRRMLGEM